MKKFATAYSLPGKSGLASTLAMVFLLLFTPGSSFAHQGDEHPEKDSTEQHVDHDEEDEESDAHPVSASKVTADFDDFPNLHPLLVHFPIVLLILAAILGVANIFFLKKEIDWILTGTVLIGALGAYAAGNWFHPHAHDLTENAKLVLGQHDLYAEWTIYLSIAALVAQLLNQFLFQGKRWAVIVVAVVLLGAAYTVSRAGHYGAQLVYIEGVGPQGDYLETGAHSH